jgi:hypothetical protein
MLRASCLAGMPIVRLLGVHLERHAEIMNYLMVSVERIETRFAGDLDRLRDGCIDSSRSRWLLI